MRTIEVSNEVFGKLKLCKGIMKSQKDTWGDRYNTYDKVIEYLCDSWLPK